MIWLEILVLAVVQGIAEFLPISSSGHIVVGAALFDLPMEETEKLTVNIVLHAGTLLAILVFYWQRIRRLLGEDRRVILLLIVGSLPAAIAGLVVKRHFADTFMDPLTAGLMFPVTGAMLLWGARRQIGDRNYLDIGYKHALIVGIFQAFAILPGISRSGATIVAGLGCGLRRVEAATFSFLLAVPAITGATLLELKDLLDKSPESVPLGALLLGVLVSFLVGLFSLWWLVRWLERGRLHRFAFWVIPLGLAVVAWRLLV